MREIKFRGKRVDTGEWVQGSLVTYNERAWIHVTDQEMTHEEILECGMREYEVDPETVGQFTGLRDKNGVEIYEGDVVKCVALDNDHHQRGTTEYRAVRVFMGNSCLCWRLQETGITIFPYMLNHELEIIGNVHDNPELLEE